LRRSDKNTKNFKININLKIQYCSAFNNLKKTTLIKNDDANGEHSGAIYSKKYSTQTLENNATKQFKLITIYRLQNTQMTLLVSKRLAVRFSLPHGFGNTASTIFFGLNTE